MNDIARKLYLKFTVIYGHKFTKDYPNDMAIQAWWEEWGDGLRGIDLNYIKEALDYCKFNFKWAPTMSEFIDLCDKAAGMPTPQEAMHLAIRRDFTKPIVKTIFEKIGSWDMQHDSEAVLIKKFKEWHAIEVAKLREDRKKLALANKGISHGRENCEQRRSIDHDELGANSLRKAESYLPH